MANENKRQSQKYPIKKIDLSPDPNTNLLVSHIVTRDRQGMDKFGVTMRSVMLKNPTDALHWLNNALEESIDLSRYLIEAIQSFRNLNENHKHLEIKYEKLKKKFKEQKEISKMMYEHP